MAVLYNSIFRASGSGEDAETSACGLSYAYMRYLLSVATFPHTFRDANNSKVELNDAERQLLESGNAVLSALECLEMPKLVLDRNNTSNQVITTNSQTDLQFNNGTIDTEYVTIDEFSQVVHCKKEGLYKVGLYTRVVSSSPNETFRQIVGVKRNGTNLPMFYDGIRTISQGSSGFYAVYRQMLFNDYLNFTYQHFASGSVTLNGPSCRVQVVYYG